MRLPRAGSVKVLTVAAALLIGFGLSLFLAATEDTRYRMVEDIKGRWQTEYDIVVRPHPTAAVRPAGGIAAGDRREGSSGIWGGLTVIRPLPEDHAESRREGAQELLEPNYVCSSPGGISIEQWQTIAAIPGVEVAAPVAVVGTTLQHIQPATGFVAREQGVYRVEVDRTYHGGPEPVKVNDVYYWCLGDKFLQAQANERRRLIDNGCVGGQGPTSITYPDELILPIVAVEPQAEARLVGLDRAVVGQYLPDEYSARVCRDERLSPSTYLQIPVIVRRTPAMAYSHDIRIYRLPVDDSPADVASLRQRGRDWLDGFNGRLVHTSRATEADLFAALVTRMKRRDSLWRGVVAYKSGGLNYAFRGGEDLPRIEPVGLVGKRFFGLQYLYRRPYLMDDLAPRPGDWVHAGQPHITCTVLGLYDVDRLDVGRDPLVNLPMGTYRPGEGVLVALPDGTPLDNPIRLSPQGPDLGLLSVPPLMLTTLDVARVLFGDECISAVRVRVAGGGDLTDEAQRRIE